MVRCSTLTAAQTLDALVAEIATVEPELAEMTVRGILEVLVPRPEKRTILLQHFDRFPNLLTSGDPLIPPIVQRLLERLAAAGAVRIVRPRCAVCGGEKILCRRLADGRKACAHCGREADPKPCSRCGNMRVITRRTSTEQLCLRCYRHDPISHKTCSRCGRNTYAVVRIESGSLCTTCAPRKLERCGQCGHDRNPRTILLGAPICRLCYEQLRRNPGTCPACAQIKILAYLSDDERRICATCAGERSPFACADCGREDHQYGRRCAVCVLTERATALLNTADGTVNRALEPVLSALLAVDRPKSTLFWLQQSHGADLLRRMAIGDIEISHDALDALPRTRALDYLRDFLAALGVLPPQHVELERLTPWLRTILADLPVADARVVHPYAEWHVLRRTRAKADRGRLTAAGARNGRALIRTAGHFLGWLTEHGTTLTTARQSHLDEYLVGHPGRVRFLDGFLTWAHDRRLIADLRTPRQQRSEPDVTLADDHRWTIVEELLHDETLPLDTRVAGLFVLLFGQPVTRICRMTPDQIATIGPEVTVRFGDDPILLPTPLDELTRALLHRRGRASYASKPNRWLFPGGHPGRHRSADVLRNQLAQAGVTVRPARNAALLQLAAEVPAPILADLLGIKPGTAVNWAALASQDWAGYTALRAENRTESSGNIAHNE